MCAVDREVSVGTSKHIAKTTKSRVIFFDQFFPPRGAGEQVSANGSRHVLQGNRLTESSQGGSFVPYRSSFFASAGALPATNKAAHRPFLDGECFTWTMEHHPIAAAIDVVHRDHIVFGNTQDNVVTKG
jgi:hypothetical protein